jgi:hypothetical protein
MERERAVEVIKQIFENCSYAYAKSITLLMHPNNNLSKGIQIQLEIGNDEILQSCVKRIARKNDLAVKKTGTLLIIYKPENKNSVT